MKQEAKAQDKLRDFFARGQFMVIKIRGKKEIAGWYGSKTSPCWGQGDLGNSGYYLLAQFSPQHKGDKATVIVCRKRFLPKEAQ